MTKKEVFINEIEQLLKDSNYELAPDAQTYFEALKMGAGTGAGEKPAFTETGAMILKFMQENYEATKNLFKAKDMADQMGVGSRTVSGSMKKLITDGYVEKIEGSSPAVYSLTPEGKDVQWNED